MTAATALLVGVPTEIKADEGRVAITPDGVRELHAHGVDVLVQAGAGAGASIPDDEFRAVGAEVVATAAEVWERAGLICKVKEPQESELGHLRGDQVLFTYLHLAAYPKVADASSPPAPPPSPTRRSRPPTDGYRSSPP
ncbi:MAG: hypothetical protein R2701_11460 [Acidimicrobiales bacterium]